MVPQIIARQFSAGSLRNRAVNRANFLSGGLGAEQSAIMKSLVPVDNWFIPVQSGLYATPSTPADPTDCARYPDSPWCGGFPFDIVPTGLNPQIVKDDCNIGISLTPTIAFIRLPQLNIVYRQPKCRNIPDRFESDPSLDNVEFPPSPCKPHSPCSTVFYLAKKEFITDYYFDPASTYNADAIDLGVTAGQSYNKTTWEYELIRFEFPYKRNDPTNPSSFEFGRILTYLTFSGTVTNIVNAKASEIMTAAANRYGYPVPEFNFIKPHVFNVPIYEAFSDIDLFYPEISSFNGRGLGLQSGWLVDNIIGTGEGQHTISEGEIYQCEYEYAREKLKNKTNTFGAYEFGSDVDHIVGYSSEESHYRIESKCSSYNRPPPPPQDICCMPQCCPPPDNALLKSLIKKVNKLSEIIGVDEYPASMPKSLISKDEGFLGNLIPNSNDNVPNLTQLLGKFIHYYDELMGQWEIPIEVKDTDPSTPGDQPQGFKLTNLSEAMAELFSIAFQSHVNTELLCNMLTRNLIETGADKQQNFITYKLLQALTDWVGFKQGNEKLKMPLSFTPGKTRWDELLQDTQIDVVVPEFDEKLGLEADLIRFRRMAAIIEANFYRKVDANGDIKAQLMKTLKDTLAASKNLSNIDETSFGQFINDAEIGFTNTPGITDTQHPYGESLEHRPRIRDLTKPPTETP